VGDVARQDSGEFGLSDSFQQELAAEQINEQFPDVDIGFRDVRTDFQGGFTLSDQGEREVAASNINEQLEDIDVGVDDITQQGEEFTLSDEFVEDNREYFTSQ